MAAGGAHTAAVTETSVYSWGSNSAGQLGSRTFRDKAAPTEVKDLAGKGVVQVACGAEHSLFLLRRAALLKLCLRVGLPGGVRVACGHGCTLRGLSRRGLAQLESRGWPTGAQRRLPLRPGAADLHQHAAAVCVS